MRYDKCLVTVLLACVVLAGCSNSKRDSGERLAGKIDEARRLFDHATAILANPPDIKASTAPADATNKVVDIPTTMPVGCPDAEKKLAQAEKILIDAISANPEAPLGTKTDALHLLGQIHLETGKHHAVVAEHLRVKADDIRMLAHNALALARSNTIQVQFGTKLANLPNEKIIALQDETAKQSAEMNSAIANIDNEIAEKTRDNGKLIEENEALLVQSRSPPARSEVIGGPQGLELLKNAQTIESEVNKKTSGIAANQQEIEVLEFNKVRLRQNVRDTEAKLAAIKKRLQETEQFAVGMMEDVKVAQQRASEQQQEAEKYAGQVVECCKDIAGREKLAIAALDKAGTRLGEAQKTLRERIDAAKTAMKETDTPNEILKSGSDEGRLVIIITARGSASLALGDLRRRQIATAKANAALADAIEQQAATLAGGLKGYLTDADKTKTLAEENYKEAEDQLQGIRKLRLEGDAGNTSWMSQAMLADAYLGHFYLTGQSDVLAQASQFVDEALADKEASPYLKRVVDLQRLIQSAGK